MVDLTKIPLSASTDGKNILVTSAVVASGSTIHVTTTEASAGQGDEIVLYAYNSSTTGTETLTIQWGGTSDPNDLMEFLIPSKQHVPMINGLILRNNLTIKAASTTANKVTVNGYVVRAT